MLRATRNARAAQRGNAARPRRTAQRTRSQESELLNSTDEGGELIPEDPLKGREKPGHGTVMGKHERDLISYDGVNETATDSRMGSVEYRSESMT